MLKKVKKKSKQTTLPKDKSIFATSTKDYIQMFYGPPGVGKTTFVNDLSDRTLFISTDRGTRFLSAMRVECNNYKQLVKTIGSLEKLNVKKLYDIICIDHIDDVCNMIEDDVCERLGIEALGDAGWAKGWKEYRKSIWGTIQRLMNLDIGLVFIAHETIKTIRTKVMETERTMPDLAKTAWKVIIPKCDLVGYCGFRLVKKGGHKKEIRTLETSPKESLYAKDRTKRIPDERGFEELNGKIFMQSFGKERKLNGKKIKKIKKIKKKKSR